MKKKPTTGQIAANAIGHALVGGVVAELSGTNATAGAVGAAGGELAARAIANYLYPGKTVESLSDAERAKVSNLASLAATMAAGLATDSSAGAVAGHDVGKNAVDNNYLSQKQKAQREKELAACDGFACRVGIRAKWKAIDAGQDGSFASGMVAGVPVGLYDTIDGIVSAALSPIETYEALKTLFTGDNVLGNISDAVKQSYIDRINYLEEQYERAGAAGSFNSGMETGKLISDAASLLAGGAGLAKGAAVVTEKVVAKAVLKSEQLAADAARTSNTAAHNAAKYAALKMDLKTTEAANDVVESLRATGELPQNYVTKAQAVANGWRPGKALNNTTPGGQLGGDVFENTTNALPSAPGRVWKEADIGLDNTMSRSNQAGTRLLYSSDGLLYITTDHYESVTSIGKWK
ncbi:VENN motif pre-toxin domain-containing protein [Pectobacterium sp. CFBP8739]|uniref:VENN motif pre-toxin domain-containing protein n=1 Tax=Pectobacterium sp. CFBP8739 TaxID=2748908 RepID=UPI0021047A4E|nr:VENN motif pre-toxin domain-containing protein [Pectobacterium sp. CFBP8739]